MANELDELMLRIADDPTMPQPGDIDKLIAYYRQKRADLAAGKKPAKAAGPKMSLDSVINQLTIGQVEAKPAPTVKRRV